MTNSAKETWECREFATFLDNHQKLFEAMGKPKLLFSKITQDFFMGKAGKKKDKSQWAYLAVQKAEGKRKGVPDFIVVIPKELSRVNRPVTLFVEMKRTDMTESDKKPEQIEFVDLLSQVGDVEARFCAGANEAINFVKHYLK